MEAESTPPSMPLPTRLIKVFFSPGEVFDYTRTNPVWFGALAVSAGLIALSMLLIPSEIWIQGMREQAARQGGEMPGFLTSAGPVFRLISAVSGVVGTFLMTLLVAGVVTLFFAFLLGDEGKYKQYLSVQSHALIIGAIASLLLVPLRIVQEDPSLTLNLGTFLPVLQEGYAFRVLKLIDLFGIWSSFVMAVGVTKIDPRRGFGVALSFFLALAVAMALVFGIFGG